MSKRNKKQSEPSARVAPIVYTQTDTDANVEAATAPIVPTVQPTFLINVDGAWLSSFAPFKTTILASEALRLDHDSATGFARHIEFRKKGICEIVPV